MSRVVILGHAPLPWEDLRRSYGPGTRTWQFARPLLFDGHEVTVIASRIPFVYEETDPVEESREQGCTVFRMTPEAFETGGFADRLIAELDPDCVVGATAYPSYVAAVYAGSRPLWADIFGSLLAEGQAKAAVYGDDAFLDHFQAMNHHILLMADRFSTVSTRQSYELVGQLGSARRLTSRTLGYDFACSIPCGVTPIEFPQPAYPDGLGPGDFIVLWSGGFNTWTDVGTLFEGLELAMEVDGRIRFVSTGAEIEGHDEKTYKDFAGMVASSPNRDRYHLLGWVKRSEAMSYYGTASVGINIDSTHYEVTFGSRNRILEWGLAGLPALTTDLCELTSELSDEGLLFTFGVKDPRALADRLVGLARDEGSLESVSERLAGFIGEKYSFERTTGPLREWVAAPAHAPDFPERLPLRMEALEMARKAHEPPITPSSGLAEKLAFYLKHEGVGSTLRRTAGLARRRLGG